LLDRLVMDVGETARLARCLESLRLRVCMSPGLERLNFK
jgi:hypothetical protein